MSLKLSDGQALDFKIELKKYLKILLYRSQMFETHFCIVRTNSSALNIICCSGQDY